MRCLIFEYFNLTFNASKTIVSLRNTEYTVFVVLQAYCTLHAGRTEPSLGRRRRDVSDKVDKNDTAVEIPIAETTETAPAEEEKVRQVIEVYKR